MATTYSTFSELLRPSMRKIWQWYFPTPQELEKYYTEAWDFDQNLHNWSTEVEQFFDNLCEHDKMSH